MNIAIIDHSGHECFIESVDDNIVNKAPYNGNVDAYIKDMYNFTNEHDSWSWEVVSAIMVCENGAKLPKFQMI